MVFMNFEVVDFSSAIFSSKKDFFTG